MYKTSVITDEISQDIITAAQLARRYGLDSLEIRSVNEKNPFQMDKKDFKLIKEAAAENGLNVCAVSSPFFKCSIDDEQTIFEHYEGLRRCIEAAHIWGCKIIRGFTFWNDGSGTKSYEKIALYYLEAIRLAKENEILMAIESEPSVCTYNSFMLAEFLDLVDSPYITALWDPGNEICDPAAPPPYPDGYERLHRYISHIHLKDIRRTDTGYNPVLMGDGDVAYHDIFTRLINDGYAGYISLETHYRHLSRLDESALVKPQGSGFSIGGYEATTACLDILRDKYNWMGSVK